jgi:hypothetical protein
MSTRATTTTTMTTMTTTNYLGALSLPILIIRVISPTLVLLLTASLVFIHPPAPTSPSPITSVVVASRVPRRAFILTLLSLSALTFLLDGLTLVTNAVLDKHWPPTTGIEINAIVGLAAFGGLAAVGSWKDIQGTKVWLSRRVKAVLAAALGFDVVLVILLEMSIHRSSDRKIFVLNSVSF